MAIRVSIFPKIIRDLDFLCPVTFISLSRVALFMKFKIDTHKLNLSLIYTCTFMLKIMAQKIAC